MKRLACIYNASSGTSQSKDVLEGLFKEQQLEVDFLDIKMGEQVLLKEIKQHDYTALVAAGGDGTVRLTAQLAVIVKLPLGVLPVGTLNHFAKELELPLKLEEAVQVIAKGRQRKIDYCSVNDRVFVNNASIGIYPSTVLGREAKQHILGKWLAALTAFLAALFVNHTTKVSVTTPEGNWTHHTALLFVGNNEYHLEKVGFTSRERVDGGKLFIYVVHATRRLALLRIALLSLVGMRARKSDFIKLSSGPITIESKKASTDIALDGEVMKLGFPLEFQMHAGELIVFCDELQPR